MPMSDKQFKRLMLRGMWAILFAILRIASKMHPGASIEEVEIELRQAKDDYA